VLRGIAASKKKNYTYEVPVQLHVGGIVYLHLGGITTPTYYDTSTRYNNTFEEHLHFRGTYTPTKYTVALRSWNILAQTEWKYDVCMAAPTQVKYW
jgi:hypothetical protein